MTSYFFSGWLSGACKPVLSWDEGRNGVSGWVTASSIYRLFLHVAPGDICSVQVVCFLQGCCLGNSTEMVLIRLSTGNMLTVAIRDSYTSFQEILGVLCVSLVHRRYSTFAMLLINISWNLATNIYAK